MLGIGVEYALFLLFVIVLFVLAIAAIEVFLGACGANRAEICGARGEAELARRAGSRR